MTTNNVLGALRGGLTDGDSMLRTWAQLKKIPGGRLLFSKAIGQMAPYTGSMGARVVQLERGYARVELTDRRAVRNHLDSIHAIALMNLAEMTSGLAMISGFPPNTRGILKGLRIEYLKKSRGTITGEATVTLPPIEGSMDHTLHVELRNTDGEIVARAEADWRIGPAK